MGKPREILERFWGFNTFRPLQEEIVQSVIDGHDTLALLPTGGGKSICFQVPALCLEKLCIVISPLIALMKDQVENLEKKGIQAGMISSSMKALEIDMLIDRCQSGQMQFLYVSPERLKSERFREVLPNLNIGMIAVDEAHCISQWGYDFRPSYTEIAQIRELLPDIPIIALTATATPEVCDDIEKQLQFKNSKRFKKSFTRSNLAYIVRFTEDKTTQLLRILQHVSGSSVVYVRNRKRCKEISEMLLQAGISASYYHAGLDGATRNYRQLQWIEGRVRVMVCTNAFGMGIDKPDVRSVIHLEMPDSPEAYFQEAGRAGRDGEKAFAVLLSDEGDERDFEDRFNYAFPGFDTIKAMYNWLGNYLQLPVGSGQDQTFAFDLGLFAKRYKHHPVECYSALRFLEREGLISLQENFYQPSRIFIPVNQQEIYYFEFQNPTYEAVLKTLLRSYGGLFQEYVQIREQELAERIQVPIARLIEMLNYLDKSGMISYYPAINESQIYFTLARQHPDRIPISLKRYEERRTAALTRMQAMMRYVKETQTCRSKYLVDYFGEIDALRCGQCDVCLEQAKAGKYEAWKDRMLLKIQQLLVVEEQSPEQIIEQLPDNPAVILEAIREWIDEGILKETETGLIRWNTPN
ncbi:MAG TPA: ATP-dependent DNA helicase RecQ [Flavobacteriales bacterium]|nr:ATP-dependent DNA helicase RecQ [Flavobacteriales bacterium]